MFPLNLYQLVQKGDKRYIDEYQKSKIKNQKLYNSDSLITQRFGYLPGGKG